VWLETTAVGGGEEFLSPVLEDQRFPLAPGQSKRGNLLFELAVGEWGASDSGVSVVRNITVTDQFADGVLDLTQVTLHANAIEAQGPETLAVRRNWAGREEAPIGMAKVQPTERTYRRLPTSPVVTKPRRWWAPWRNA